MIEVWLIPADVEAEQARALYEFLDPDERDRAARTPAGPQRHRFIAAHAVARQLTAAAADLPPERVRWRRGPHGRPEAVGLEREWSVNLSTSGGWALFALAPADGGRLDPVGVDLEPVPADGAAARLAHRYFPQGETGEGAAEFTVRWTRKEAYTKAFGGRLADGLRTPAGPLTPGPHLLTGPLGPCTVTDLPAPPGHRAALARRGAHHLDPQLRTYPPTRPHTDPRATSRTEPDHATAPSAPAAQPANAARRPRP
ncbi:4'-phosphopantetheinyl transferase superfamily protein [Kitasatospora sp. NPDC049285]|uniref:4'-phosphopantetheinyl transferase family protein n=1 Tax=Kitasatospora sp. NPDC049285 TaxID=3157096 RepID=UPI003441198C